MLRYFTTIKSSEITSVAVGSFDGMHLGHKALVERLDKNGVLLVIDKGYANLTPSHDRCRYVQNGCVFLNLDDVKDMSVDEFLSFLKRSFPLLKKIVVGYDFRFGKGRSGDATSFKKFFDVDVVGEVKVEGISVHSKDIREFIKNGEFKKANSLLGRAYKVVGKSVKGQGIGAKKLVATINLKTEYLLPKDGVYVTKAYIDDKEYKSISFVGVRKTTDGEFAFETHLLDEELSFLPKRVEVEFVKYLRANKKFDTIESLKIQIEDDINKARKIFESESKQ